MNKVILGALGALVMAAIGLVWMQGRAQVEEGAPPPEPLVGSIDPAVLPSADISGLQGPPPPEATELTKEQQRFGRYDRDRDGRITRNEMLSTRTNAFRKLDTDGNNLLDFEEWAVATVDRFENADTDNNDELTAREFATTRPKQSSKRRCRC